MKLHSCFRNLAATLVLALPLAQEAHAQATPPTRTTVVTAGPDSAQVSTQVVPDSVRRTARLFGLKMTKPAKAGFLSALLPGAGQIYNRRWWKLPLVYGAVGGTLYGELFYLGYYKDFVEAKRLRNGSSTPSPKETTLTSGYPNSTIQRYINTYRRQRDVFIAYVALAYGVQILDAVVDAHLRDFDISDDLSLQLEPTMLRMPTAAITPAIGITLTFK